MLTDEFTSLRDAITDREAMGQIAMGDGVVNATHELMIRWHRPSADPVLVVLSDGRVTGGEDPLEVAQVAKDAGIPSVTIGLGYQIDQEQLRSMASSPAHYHDHAPSSAELEDVVAAIAQAPCR
jgi:Mg-chelatase subunit ChlD